MAAHATSSINMKCQVKALLCGILLAFGFCFSVSAREYFVDPTGNDSNPGTKRAPLRTIQRGAQLAQPGDVVTVRAGVYRERINPPRGGTSERKRIVYQAARGERVEIKGSEVIKNWEKVEDGVWKVTLPNAFFGAFNPYSDAIHGDWFEPKKGRQHHTGAVYLNSQWLVEASNLDEVLAPGANSPQWLKGWTLPYAPQLWFAQVSASNTTIWAQFKNANPNDELVEINVRRTVFYPTEPGRNYITVRNFVLRQAATPWAPPTAEQVGLIGTHWSKGWIIESNIISHSTCSGIALGKYGDQWDNTSANSAEGYVKTIERALQNGWNRATIGHHIVLNNVISDCEQAGIVGSLGAAFCTISGNVIHDIHVRHLFSGAEMAGIKFHGAVDTVIRNNHIYRTCRGLWLDWMAQGTRVSSNLFHDNASEDVFVEVDHGPFMMDNNLFLSSVSLLDMSEGGTYAHNLFKGRITTRQEPSRQTPYHPAHETRMAGLARIKGGDDRFYNNVLIGPGGSLGDRHESPPKDPEWGGGFGLWVYDFREFPLQVGGNIYYNGARPYARELDAISETGRELKPSLSQEDGHFTLHMSVGEELKRAPTQLVTTRLLGLAKVPQVPYETAAGAPLKIDSDFFGKPRGPHPTPGPFESPGAGNIILTVW